MAKENTDIKLTIKEIVPSFIAIKDTMDANAEPFRGQAKRLLWDLQSEVEWIQGADEKTLDSNKDKELNFGKKIAPPQSYPSEYKEILGKVCQNLPEKKSKIEALLKK